MGSMFCIVYSYLYVYFGIEDRYFGVDVISRLVELVSSSVHPYAVVVLLLQTYVAKKVFIGGILSFRYLMFSNWENCFCALYYFVFSQLFPMLFGMKWVNLSILSSH